MQGKDMQYQQLDDEIEQGKQNAQNIAKEVTPVMQEIGAKAIELAPQVLNKGEEYMHMAEEGYQKVYDITGQALVKGGIYYEQGENYLRDHSETIRVIIAVITFPIWLPFYQFLHTTVRGWEVVTNVLRKIKSTTKKMVFIFLMLTFGCYPFQLILSLFGFVHLFQHCTQFKQQGSVYNGFHVLVYEKECIAAKKAQEVLEIVFADKDLQDDESDKKSEVSYINELQNNPNTKNKKFNAEPGQTINSQQQDLESQISLKNGGKN